MTQDPFVMPPPAPIQPARLGVATHMRWAKAGAVAAAVAGVCMSASNYLAAVTAEDDLTGALAILALVGVTALGGITGYLTLSLWMTRVRDIVGPQGYPAPASWKIWAGWLIPFYGLVAPLKVMDALGSKAGKDRMTVFLALWWGGYLVYGAGNYFTGISTLDAGSAALTAGVMSVAVLVSMGGLLALLTHISASAAAPTPAPGYGAAPSTFPTPSAAQPPYGYPQQ